MSNPGGFSDTDKLMYLAYRAEMIAIRDLELTYDYYWRDYIHCKMNPGCPLTMTYDEQQEEMRSSEIERLLKRKRLDDAFDCAIGS